MTYHIVLTGGVASGKSAASHYFEELGVTVIDADVIAREVVAIGSEGLKAVTEYFGKEVLNNDGSLNRKALRSIVFDNKKEREWLNQLLHPMIRSQMKSLRDESEESKELYTISVIPLYAETIYGTNEAKQYRRVLVVDTTESVQRERLMQRDSSSSEQADALIRAQASRQERLLIADDVISNNSDLQSLKQQVINLDKQYRDLARG